MPPKKKDDGASNKPPVFFGRMGTNLKIGIVGLPNVGLVDIYGSLLFLFFNHIFIDQGESQPLCMQHFE